MGFNNFMRFLKEYQLVDSNIGGKGIGIITHNKTGAVTEYRKIGSERAQLVFK